MRVREQFGDWDTLHEHDTVWDVCARHDQTEARQQERDDAERALDSQMREMVLDHVSRVTSTEVSPLVIGGIELRINNEFREGGLLRWPTAASFYLTLTAPDGMESMHSASTLNSYADLSRAIDEEREEWQERVVRARESAIQHLIDAQAALVAAEKTVSDLRAARNETVAAAVSAGVTAYRAAKTIGVTPKAVDDIIARIK